jgi:hypothetical protein
MWLEPQTPKNCGISCGIRRPSPSPPTLSQGGSARMEGNECHEFVIEQGGVARAFFRRLGVLKPFP